MFPREDNDSFLVIMQLMGSLCFVNCWTTWCLFVPLSFVCARFFELFVVWDVVVTFVCVWCLVNMSKVTF